MFTLKVYRGDRMVQELELDAPEVKIGRSTDNAVVLADDGKGVSRVHAIIRVEGDDHVLYDGNSRNGTFVDGKAVKRTAILPGQDFVIGPYRLIFGAGDYSGSMPTVVASRPTPPPAEAPREGTARGGSTGRGAVASQTKSGGSTKSRPAGGANPAAVHDRRALPIAYVAAAAIAAIVVIAVVVWQMLPETPPPQVAVQTSQPTTSIPEATTTIPPTTTIDPHAEPVALATQAMEAAEATVASKNFNGALREFDRILKEQIAPILAVDAAYAPALELESRLRSRMTEVRKLRLDATPPPPPLPPIRLPNDVAPRPGENDADYKRRNTEVQQDYGLARKYFNEGDFHSAFKLFADLQAREPGYLDVSAYVKNAQDGLAKERLEAMNEGLRLEGEGHKNYLAKNLADAATQLSAARRAFDRAAALQAPGADKQIADNMERRRLVGRAALALAYTHANQRNRAEAQKWFQLVIDLLPAADPIRQEATASLKKIAP